MRNAWRLGLVLLLCGPAWAPDEMNPYDPPGGFSQPSGNRAEFDLRAFYGQTGGSPESIRKELKSPRQRDLVANALCADPHFLQTIPREAALAFLVPLTVAQHARLKTNSSLNDKESLRELIREGRILSYLESESGIGRWARKTSFDSAGNLGVWGAMGGMLVWLGYLYAGYVPKSFPGFLGSGLAGILGGFFSPLAGLAGLKLINQAISDQLLFARLRQEAREVGVDWQPSNEFFAANTCGYERLRKSPLNALRPQ